MFDLTGKVVLATGGTTVSAWASYWAVPGTGLT